MRNRLNILFYTFLVIFALTALVTLLGVLGVVKIPAPQLQLLLAAFLIELAGAVIALFRGTPFFGAPKDLASSVGSSIKVIDDVSPQIQELLLGPEQAKINRQYAIIVRDERGELVAYQRKLVITKEQLQGLSAEQRDLLESYENSMNRFHEKWKSTWAMRSAATTPQEDEQIDAELQRLVRGMQKDLHAIIDFLAKQGMVLKDHYEQVRTHVDALVAGQRRRNQP